MDERQSQIRERAGLEEARYNLEFIDWLRKWGVPILFVFAIVAAAYGLHDRWQRSQNGKLDDAWAELDSVVRGANPSPDTLLQIAADHSGVNASVSHIARLEAADSYLDAVRRGVRPGVQPKSDGSLENPDDALKPADRTTFLDKAGDLYNQVYTATKADNGKSLLTIGALFGMASVAESKEDFTKAKANYDEVAKIAEAAGFPDQAAVAKDRAANIDQLKTVPTVYSKADLPPVPEAPKPVITPIDASQLPPGLIPQTPAPQTDPMRQPATPGTEPAPAAAPTTPAPTTPEAPTPAAPTSTQPSAPPAPTPVPEAPAPQPTQPK